MKAITEKQLLEQIKTLITFPNPTVCKHWVACNLLSLMEENGCELDRELVKAIVDADDETSVRILNSRTE